MLQCSGHRSLRLMGQPGEAFVCARLSHIPQHVRQDNAKGRMEGFDRCKAQIMLYVELRLWLKYPP